MIASFINVFTKRLFVFILVSIKWYKINPTETVLTFREKAYEL